MEAVVLCGGLGTRLRSILPDQQKCMAPILGMPFLEILLKLLARSGFGSVVLAAGYKSDDIASRFGSQYGGMSVHMSIEEAPLGTAGAVRLAMQRVAGDHFVVLNGDTFLLVDFLALEDLWLTHQDSVIVAREVPEVDRYGCLNIQDGRVLGIFEKGGSGKGFVNAGCYLFNRAEFESFKVHSPLSLEKDVLPALIEARSVRALKYTGPFIDIGIPESFRAAEAILRPLSL